MHLAAPASRQASIHLTLRAIVLLMWVVGVIGLIIACHRIGIISISKLTTL
jgi:hypothetical protein